MLVRLKLLATFRQYLPPHTTHSSSDVQVSSDTQVCDLLVQFGVPIDELLVVLVNGVQSDLGRVLEEGDVVTTFPVMGGGDGSSDAH